MVRSSAREKVLVSEEKALGADFRPSYYQCPVRRIQKYVRWVGWEKPIFDCAGRLNYAAESCAMPNSPTCVGGGMLISGACERSTSAQGMALRTFSLIMRKNQSLIVFDSHLLTPRLTAECARILSWVCAEFLIDDISVDRF